MVSTSEIQVTSIRTILNVAPFFLIAGLFITLFSPGHFSGDTADSYLAATGGFRYEDWHSPMLGVVWHALLMLWNKPQVLLVFNMACFCTAIYLISHTQKSQFEIFSKLYWCGIFFMPFIFNYSGALIKDTSSAALMVVAVALYAVDVFRRGALSLKFRLVLHIFANAFVLCAVLIKPGALFMAIPLFFFSMLRFRSTPSRWFVVTSIVVSVVLTPVLFSITYSALKGAVNAKVTNVRNAILVYDLSGMSNLDRKNYLDGFIDSKNVDNFFSCYNHLEWDNLAWGNCSFVIKDIDARDLWKGDSILNRWLYTVINNPWTYAEHRTTHLSSVLKTTGKHLFYIDRSDARLPWKVGESQLMRAISKYYASNNISLSMFKPIIWLVMSAILLFMALYRLRKKPSNSLNTLIVCLLLSNIAFFVTLLFFGVAYDFRYFYTVIWQAMIAAGLFFFSPDEIE